MIVKWGLSDKNTRKSYANLRVFLYIAIRFEN